MVYSCPDAFSRSSSLSAGEATLNLVDQKPTKQNQSNTPDVKPPQMPFNLSSFHVGTDQSCHQKLAYDNDQESVANHLGHSQQHSLASQI